MQENCNAIFVSPQVNELNVACHCNVELIFEWEKPRYNGINQMGLNPKRRGLLGGVNELNVACHGNVELIFERGRPR